MKSLKIESEITESLVMLLVAFLEKTDKLTNEEFLTKFQFHRRTIERQIKNNTKISKKYFIPIINFLYPSCDQGELVKLIGEEVWHFIYEAPRKNRSTCIKLAPINVQLNQTLAKLFNEAERGICVNDGKKKFGESFLGFISQLERYGLVEKASTGESKWYSIGFKDHHPILFELWKSNFGN